MKPRLNRAVTALATVTAVMAAVVLVTGPGYQTENVRMLSGAVWLASAESGEATLLDGVSAEVKTHVQVAEPGTALSVAQWNNAAVTLNRETGELRTVDGATEQVAAPVEVLPASDGLTVLPAQEGLYAIDVHSGLVAVIDPMTMKPKGEPVSLASSIRPDSTVVDARGRLWAIDDSSGDLVWLDDDDRPRTRAGAATGGHLAIVQGRPALVDPQRGTAELLDPETGMAEESVRPGLPAGSTVVTGGSVQQSRVHVVTGDRGEMITCGFGTGSCSTPVPVGSAGAEFGTPVEVDGHVVVPDYTTGQATIVDLTGSRVVAQRQLFDRPTRFELLVRDGIVFFNDVNGDKAGVLELSGEIRAVTKYTGKPAENDSSRPQDNAAQSQQVTEGQESRKPAGVGVPRRTFQPSKVHQRPGPVTASILVEPGHQGRVGDEFDLTLMVPSPPGLGTTVWQFGDGTEATGDTVRHSWQRPGSFPVRASRIFADGLRADAETTVVVDPAEAPVRITALNVQRPRPVMGESVRFSADTTTKPDTWTWAVTRAGGTEPVVTSKTAEFSHTFTEPGHYTLTLTVSAGLQPAQSSRPFTITRGAVKNWGYNNDGEMTPPPAASSGVVALAGGWGHTLALKANGSVIAWGADFNGSTSVPLQAQSGVVAISAGGHNMALKENGSVFAWGSSNSENELNVPKEAQRDVIAISAGGSHSLALRSDGRVIAWGANYQHQTDVPKAAESGVISIFAGSGNSMALKADGSVVVWGDDACVSQTPVTGVTAIGMLWQLCLAVKEDGSVFTWGVAHSGEDEVPAGAMSNVVAITGRAAHVLALREDGTAVGWGMNDRGQATVPPQINKGVMAVAAGSGYSLVLLEDVD